MTQFQKDQFEVLLSLAIHKNASVTDQLSAISKAFVNNSEPMVISTHIREIDKLLQATSKAVDLLEYENKDKR